MKAIEKLEKERFKSGFTGAVLAVVGIIVVFITQNFDFIWLFVVIFIVMNYYSPILCPFCKAKIILPAGTKSLNSHQYRYCHSCGADFNKEIEETETKDAP